MQKQLKQLREKFEAAMNDDLNTSVALSVVFELVRIVNKLLEDNSATAETLNAVDGIGLKKAESIIVQLKDRVKKLELSHSDSSSYKAATMVKQLSEVLSSLGYSRFEINSAIERVKQNGRGEGSFDSLLRASLSLLAKKSL